MGDAVLLEYIRAMLGVATPKSGNPKPIRHRKNIFAAEVIFLAFLAEYSSAEAPSKMLL